jgi:exopolysaccharide production protein ExoZ
MHRIDSLDWQRGLLAFAIMAYHLTSWELHALDASTLLGRLGIYGVSMFFVLSGLSMALVYNGYIRDAGSSLRFFVRRIARIWPLLWVAVAFATGTAILAGQPPYWWLILVNLTTAFGFVDPAAYMNVGAWSIGNEMVYYALTPLFIVAYNRSLVVGNLLVLAAALVGAWFAVDVLVPDRSLADQWALYINPFNNLFLYCAGIALYYNFHEVRPGMGVVAGMFVVSVAIFLLYPVAGDQIRIVTGICRLAFSVASIVLVLAFYKNTVVLPAILAAPLTRLGVVTYGVYLLHPIVYRILLFVEKKWHAQLPAPALVGGTMAVTIVLAMVSFEVLEAPVVRIGKRVTSRLSRNEMEKPGAVDARFM